MHMLRKKRTIIFIGCGLLLILLMLLLSSEFAQKRYGLQGFYYTNENWAGQPAMIRQDLTPFLKGDQVYQMLSTAVFTVMWKGWIMIDQAGGYTFATNSDDGSTLMIDGNIIVDNGGMHGLLKRGGEVALTKGVHDIEIRYAQYGGFSVIQTFWMPPNQVEQPLPGSILFPKRPHRGEIFLRLTLRRGIPVMIALNLLYAGGLMGWGCVRLIQHQRARLARLVLGIRDALQSIAAAARKLFRPFQVWLSSSKWEQPRFVLLILLAIYALFCGIRLFEFSLVKEPFIWGDEYVYRILSYRYWATGDFYASSDAIHKGVKNMPNLLYPFLISWFAGFQSFFFLTKLFNVLVMNAAIFPFFLLAKQFTSQKDAVGISALLLLMPWMNAANIVLVEPLFFLLFWVAFYLCHAFFVTPTVKSALLAGGTIALAYVTKPTGMGILLTCFGVMSLMILRKNMTRQERFQLIALSGILALSSVIGVLLVNFLLKGTLGFGLGFYQVYAEGMAKTGFLKSLFGSKSAVFMVVTHISLIFFLYLIPLAVACSAFFHTWKQGDRRASTFLAFGLLLGGIFLGITIKFTLGLGVESELERLHTRYHFMTFPFYVMAFIIFSQQMMVWSRSVRVIVNIVGIMTLLCNAFIFLPEFAYSNGYPMIIDNMEYHWTYVTQGSPFLVTIIALLNASLLLYYLFSTRRTPYPYLMFFLVFCLIANYHQIQSMRKAGSSSKKFERYKTFLALHIPDFNSKLVFIENFWKIDPYSTYTNLSHLLFWLPYDVLLHKDQGKGGKIKEKHFPQEAEYIVLSEEYILDLPYKEIWTQDEYTILKR